MIIETPTIKRVLDDYDILFSSGFLMPVTVDLSQGDTITFPDEGGAILIHLSSKPSQLQPDKTLPAEDITVFTPHIISIQHRVREVVELSPEAKTSYQKTINDLVAHPTIQ